MKQNKELGKLASDICEALPQEATDLRLYISDLGMWHLGELEESKISPRPDPMPKISYHIDEAICVLENCLEGQEGHGSFLLERM